MSKKKERLLFVNKKKQKNFWPVATGFGTATAHPGVIVRPRSPKRRHGRA
jgi:hypothetical protein